MKAEQVLTADYDWSDEPLDVETIDGLKEAVKHIQEQKEGKELVRCESRVNDYDVYWNEKTDSVRIGAVVMGCSYEVNDEQ